LKRKKVISTIYINATVLQKAKQVGLNISKTCENALQHALTLLEERKDVVEQQNSSGNVVSIGR